MCGWGAYTSEAFLQEPSVPTTRPGIRPKMKTPHVSSSTHKLQINQPKPAHFAYVIPIHIDIRKEDAGDLKSVGGFEECGAEGISRVGGCGGGLIAETGAREGG
mmetsp:Transcript_39694/g.65184  ORF Transcript_39694/g.65184 Transcript_39694/m.65184 type:complete len:104 (+) Transcript_39694:1397-1708(+)